MAEPQPNLPPTPADTRYRILVGLALAVVAVLLFAAVKLTNTGEDADEPASVRAAPGVVEHLQPPQGSQIPRQSEIGIDLAPGYDGTLIVDGVPIPGDQERRVPQQNQIYFTPGKGQVIEELRAGQVCMTAVVWKSSVGRGNDDKSFNWCFGVT
jgi:hypothetical protein